MKALNKSELDQISSFGCMSPDCKGEDHSHAFFLHARCHPGGRIGVSYLRHSGELTINCDVCKSIIAKIAVAPGKVRAPKSELLN